MQKRSPAQLYSLIFGVILVVVGILGFFYEGSFTTGDDAPREALLGIFDVNGWHNVVHILSGVVGIALAGSYEGGRLFAFAFGSIYAVVALLGFIMGNGEVILGLIPVNTEDNLLHALIALAGIAAAFASPSVPEPTTA